MSENTAYGLTVSGKIGATKYCAGQRVNAPGMARKERPVVQRDDTAPTPTVSPSLPAWAQTPGDPDTPYWQTLIQTRYPAARVLLLDDGQLGRLITVLERMGGRLTMAAQQARQEHSDAYPQRQAEADLVAAVTARLRDQAMEQQAITDAQEAAR